MTRPTRRAVLAGIGAAALAGASRSAEAQRRPNVLFISIDDLNDWAGILGGHPHARTPNLDRLAARGVSFENAHCAAPLCNPSRTSTLTGLRPSTTGVYGNRSNWRTALPDVVSLPHLFRKQGYTTLGCGKVFHVADKKAWTEHPPSPCTRPPNAGGYEPRRRDYINIKGVRWGPSRSRRDGPHSDARVADQVSRWLSKRHDRPVFIGCGFFNPHLPWKVPRRYFEMHPLHKIEVPEVPEGDLDDVPAAGRRMAHLDIHRAITRKKAWRKAVQAYLAATSFADAQLGRVLEALAKGPKAGDTTIVVWSDHGWSLGEKFHWKKSVLWEEATRVPLVFAGRGVPKGRTSRRTVSLLDLYPTLVELAGLKPPPQAIEGRSLAPLLDDPDRPWPHAALTTMGRGNHAVRDERWRYIRYADGSEELYDHDRDPSEWDNLASRGGQAATIAQLARHLPARDAPDAPRANPKCTPG